jgi:hypothetical protein
VRSQVVELFDRITRKPVLVHTQVSVRVPDPQVVRQQRPRGRNVAVEQRLMAGREHEGNATRTAC